MSHPTSPRQIGAIYRDAAPWARVLLVAMLAAAIVGGVRFGYRALGPTIAHSDR